MPEGEEVFDEPMLSRLASQVAEAREALLAIARGEPAKWWTATELRCQVQSGWPAGTITVALSRLLTEHLLEQDARRRVRVVA